MSLPTLMLFANGEPVMRLVGARGKGQLLAELDRFL
jgi:thioredoxin 1